MEFKRLLKTREYEFLETNEHLGENIILLGLGGSHAYGTNNENSDVDIRGVALERPSDLIGFSAFDQVVETETDTTIYSFNKMVNLLIKANPNTVELLGCKQEHYLKVTDIGQQLLDNKKMFLSKQCIESFGGYASQQLSRLENSLARDRVSQEKKEEHIKKSLERAMISFETRYTQFEDNGISLKVSESSKTNLEKEIFVDINLKDYPLRDISGILSEMQSILRSYGKLNHRNKKKDDNHLDKHAMHLIRLYLMVIDMLEKEDVITYREHDLELLLNIRKGGFRKSDGTYDESFFEMLNEYEKRFEYASKHTTLPLMPNMKIIEEFKMGVNRKIILR